MKTICVITNNGVDDNSEIIKELTSAEYQLFKNVFEELNNKANKFSPKIDIRIATKEEIQNYIHQR